MAFNRAHGMEMPEELTHRFQADYGMQLWGYNQRLIFLDEAIEEVEQQLRNLRNRRAAHLREVVRRMEAYYDIRRDNGTPD